jgi:hypothetical protein
MTVATHRARACTQALGHCGAQKRLFETPDRRLYEPPLGIPSRRSPTSATPPIPRPSRAAPWRSASRRSRTALARAAQCAAIRAIAALDRRDQHTEMRTLPQWISPAGDPLHEGSVRSTGTLKKDETRVRPKLMKNLLPQRGHRACHTRRAEPSARSENCNPSDVERVDADAAREIEELDDPPQHE